MPACTNIVFSSVLLAMLPPPNVCSAVIKKRSNVMLSIPAINVGDLILRHQSCSRPLYFSRKLRVLSIRASQGMQEVEQLKRCTGLKHGSDKSRKHWFQLSRNCVLCQTEAVYSRTCSSAVP